MLSSQMNLLRSGIFCTGRVLTTVRRLALVVLDGTARGGNGDTHRHPHANRCSLMLNHIQVCEKLE
jgi:hypothetical protein